MTIIMNTNITDTFLLFLSLSENIQKDTQKCLHFPD